MPKKPFWKLPPIKSIAKCHLRCHGVITEIRFHKDDVVAVGQVLALISPLAPEGGTPKIVEKAIDKTTIDKKSALAENKNIPVSTSANHFSPLGRLGGASFLSPLIISIAQKENLSLEEVQSIPGSGAEGRIQKSDVFNYLKNRKYPITE